MSKVYTHFDRPKTIGQTHNNEYVNEWLERITPEGERILDIVGVVNVYERIQKDLESTKIENILHACAMGDFSMLRDRDVTYADATALPKNLMEAQNLVIRMKNEFYKMPYEVRKEFNNSADMYVNMMGTEEFNNIMSPFNKKVSDIQEAGNLKAYNKKVADQAKFEKDVAAAKGE